MGRICLVSMTSLSTYVILVIITIFAYVELSQSCHRRVEYVTYYKKQPHKGHGGHGHSHNGGHGGGGYGHQHGHGGHGHKGYGQSQGYGHKGYGQQQGHKGYGQQQGHKGYGQQQGHKGYGQSLGHGHKGYGGGGHHGGGGHQHGGYEHEGHGGGYQGGGGHHEEHGGYGGAGHHGGGGHQHGGYEQPKGYEHGGGHHGGGGHQHGGYEPEGYGGGHHGEHGGGGGYGHEAGHQGGGGHHGDGGGENSGQKGRKYKYQSYESTHYDDKGGGHQHQPSYGYSHNAPHYTQKGYGYSGPYPNTEYSSPVAASLDAPSGTNTFTGGIDAAKLPPQLDAADTANLIRNAYDTRENEVVHHDLGNSGGGGPLGVGNSLPEAAVVAVVDPSAVGNFDMNINYNAADLPAPFRRSSFESPNSGRRRKKISSKFRNDQSDDGSAPLSSVIPHYADDIDSSQSKHMLSGLGGPDYLENDAGDVVGANSAGPPENEKLMNF